jgi:hypothetical protein
VLGSVILVGFLTATPIAVNERPVSPSTRWLDRVATKVAVAPLNLSQTELAGTWTDEGTTSGSYLYLFPDGTFIYTEAADIMPESIYDKGTWRAESGMLTLSPDPDVTWDPKRDRHFLMLRPQAGEQEPMLFGVDRRILVFEQLVAAEPKQAAGYLVTSSLRRKGAWVEGEASHEKARLGKNSKAWQPCRFTDAGCPPPGSADGK